MLAIIGGTGLTQLANLETHPPSGDSARPYRRTFRPV